MNNNEINALYESIRSLNNQLTEITDAVTNIANSMQQQKADIIGIINKFQSIDAKLENQNNEIDKLWKEQEAIVKKLDIYDIMDM